MCEVSKLSRFRWKQPSSVGKEPGLLVTASSDGDIFYWDIISGKSVSGIKNVTGADIYTIDFSKSGTQLAVGGRDFDVKIYDDEKKTLLMTLNPGDAITLGHTNCVFSVHFTDDPNILLSGGWDTTIYIWDLRVAKGIGYIHGPHINHDSIDTKGDILLTGSFDNKDCLQLWSISNKKLITTINWSPDLISGEGVGYLTTARFENDKRNRYIFTGGRIAPNKNEIRVFRNGGKYELLSKIGVNSTVSSIDVMKTKCTFAAGTLDGFVYSFDLEENKHKGISSVFYIFHEFPNNIKFIKKVF